MPGKGWKPSDYSLAVPFSKCENCLARAAHMFRVDNCPGLWAFALSLASKIPFGPEIFQGCPSPPNDLGAASQASKLSHCEFPAGGVCATTFFPQTTTGVRFPLDPLVSSWPEKGGLRMVAKTIKKMSCCEAPTKARHSWNTYWMSASL